MVTCTTSWAQIALKLVLGPKPKGQGIFQNFMILLDSSYEVFLVKIGARVPPDCQTYDLIHLLGPSCP